MTQSPELTGGAGFNFEASVAALYLTALLSEETAPGLSNRIVKRVALQQSAFGEPLDDLIVDACSTNGDITRLSLQVKRSLTVSAAATNEDFREIVKNSWLTLQKKDFRQDVDRYGAATGTISEISWRDLCAVCEFARASLTSQTFFQRFEENGNAGQNHLKIVKVFRSILDSCAGQIVSDNDIYRFLKHFVLIKLDVLHEGATDPPEAMAQLRRSLAVQESHRAPDLWVRLEAFAHKGAGRSEEFSRSSLLARLAGEFLFIGAPSLKADLDRLSESARLSLEDITFEIDGYHLARKDVLDQANTLLESHRFVQIRGLPGTGKSALLREIAASKLIKGSVLFLKSDRLSGRSWAEFATNIGLRAQSIADLLLEIAATGTAILFIDGIDRVQPAQRNVVTDLLNTILRSPLLSPWRIVVTSRDVGIEPLRNWIPSELFSDSGIGSVNVEPLNDEEAEDLAKAKPALRPLLFGIERVKEIARRPFFASVLARGFFATTIQAGFVPQSEIDLIEVWWERGGYQAEASEIFKRQHALEELVKASAQRQGLRILRSELNSATIEVLHDLIGDGILRETQKGVALRFTHDIFFEWSYYYLLQSQDNRWIELLIGAGEPPVLGRVIELLSQSRFASSADWLSHFSKIEASSLRPQWQRAWLLGPFGAPDFGDYGDAFEQAINRIGVRLELLTHLLPCLMSCPTEPFCFPSPS